MSHDLLEELVREQAPVPRAEFVEALDVRVAGGFGDVPKHEPIWPWMPAMVRAVRSLRYRPMRLAVVLGMLAVLGGAAVTLQPSVREDRPARADRGSIPEDGTSLSADDYVATPIDGDGEALHATSGRTGGGATTSTATVSASVVDYRRHVLGSGLFLRVTPKQVPGVVADAERIARELDGYPGSTSFDVEGDRATATADLWVPTERYAEAVDRLSKLGEVERITKESRDVTGSRADLVAQIREDAELLRRAREHPPEGSYARQQREAMETQLELRRQRLANLDRRVEMTLVNVKVRGERPRPEPAPDRWSIEWALDTAATVLRAAVAIAIVAGGVVLVPAVLVVGAWLALAARRRRQRDRLLDE